MVLTRGLRFGRFVPISKPEIQPVQDPSLHKLPFGVRSAEVAGMNCPIKIEGLRLRPTQPAGSGEGSGLLHRVYNTMIMRTLIKTLCF